MADETCDRQVARAWASARGFKPADVTQELLDAPAGKLDVTKRGLRALHRVTEFEYKRAGGTVEERTNGILHTD